MSKKIILFFYSLIICIFTLNHPIIIMAKTYTKEEQHYILNLVEPSPVWAVVLNNAALKEKPSGQLKETALLYSGDRVEILKDYSAMWYYIINHDDGTTGWIDGDLLYIPATPATNAHVMSTSEIEGFVNILEFQSDTDYFVWTDISRQLTYVLKGNKKEWNLIKTLPCATGINQSPTTRGLYKIQEKGEWFYSQRLGSGAKYWVRFNGHYLFHSVSMDRNEKVEDPVLGERRSSGCIRLSVEDSRWFYETVPSGTSVFIH